MVLRTEQPTFRHGYDAWVARLYDLRDPISIEECKFDTWLYEIRSGSKATITHSWHPALPRVCENYRFTEPSAVAPDARDNLSIKR